MRAAGSGTGCGPDRSGPYFVAIDPLSVMSGRARRAQVVAQRLLARLGSPASQRPAAPPPGRNVLKNEDSNPAYPQNETAVAYDVFKPLRAVAAANDYVNGGFWIGRTRSGGRTWRTAPTPPSSPAAATGPSISRRSASR